MIKLEFVDNIDDVVEELYNELFSKNLRKQEFINAVNLLAGLRLNGTSIPNTAVMLQHQIELYANHFQGILSKYYYDERILSSALVVCPICNMNTITKCLRSGKGTLTSEFDHNMPKDYINNIDKVNDFYNLVPICHTCNHIKGKQALDFFNPLIDHELPNYRFRFDIDKLIQYILGEDTRENIESIIGGQGILKYDNWYNTVHLKTRINNSSFILKERLDLYLRIVQNTNDEIYNELGVVPEDLMYGEERYSLMPYSKIFDDLIYELMP